MGVFWYSGMKVACHAMVMAVSFPYLRYNHRMLMAG